MILLNQRLKGLAMPFRDREMSIDYTRIGPGLVAFVGGNGAGKTTALEASCPAVIYREFPYYGENFIDHVAPGVRDAFAELEFLMGGHTYKAIVQADPLFSAGRGKTEATLLKDGVPIAGPNVRDYDQAIADLFPSVEVLKTSVFCAQGGADSFFEKTKAERKDIFIQLLRGEKLQKLSVAAGERGGSLGLTFQSLRGSIDALRAQAALLRDLQREQKSILAERSSLEEILGAARASYEHSAKELGIVRMQLSAAEARAESLGRERERLTALHETAKKRVLDLEYSRGVHNETIRRAGDVAGSAEKLAEVQRRVEDLRAKERELRDKLSDAEQDLVQKKADLETLRAAYQTLKADEARALEASSAKTSLDEAVARAKPLVAAAADLGEVISDLEMRIRELEEQAQEEEGVAKERAVLKDRGVVIAERVRRLEEKSPNVCDTCPMTAELRAAKDELAAARAEYAALPRAPETRARDTLKARRETLRERQTALIDNREARSEVEREIGRLEALAAGAARLEEIRAEMQANVQKGQSARAAAADVEAQVLALKTEISDAIEKQIAKVEAVRPELEQKARLEAEARDARAKLREIEDAIVVESNARDVAAEELEKLPPIPDVAALRAREAELATQTTDEKVALDNLDGTFRRAAEQLARIEGQLKGIENAETELAGAEARVRELADEISDWAAIEKGLGREGAQALEIDAAGPGVTMLANELFQAADFGRFQLAIETTAPKKSGGWKEVFEIRIIDGEAGREARKGSGGEMVILDGGLRLAIAIYNAQKAGYDLRTLWLDESVGALSPANADRYLRMLRKAREIGGFHHVIFIAQQPEVWRQADSIISFENGRASQGEASAIAA